MFSSFLAFRRRRHGLRYFSPTEFATLRALADIVVMGENEALTAEDVARNVDRYFATFTARTKWIADVAIWGVQLYPLLTFKPLFTRMTPETRLAFIKQRFYRDINQRRLPRWWLTLIRAMIRMAKQLVYLGYYGDKRCYDAIEYVPFSKRVPAPDPIEVPALHVETPATIGTDTIEGDVVIVGSGAAAGVLAYRLAGLGRKVVMLERGAHVRPSEFSEDEIDMLSRLYSDGALQASKDFTLQILQGSCVGGSTVVNNGVCIDPPRDVLERWNNREFASGLDPDRVLASVAVVRELMQITRQNDKILNRGSVQFKAGAAALGLDQPPHMLQVVDANIAECLGCGYCNLGCAYGRKLSMLVTLLPKTQKQFGRDVLRVVSDCEAQTLEWSGDRVESVIGVARDGRRLRVRGKTFVVAAGAISSSLLLQGSRLGGDTPVGHHLSLNNGSPMFGRFSQRINAYDGLQISHWLNLSPNPGYLLETFYNSPVLTSLAMPGWFNDHFRNMRSYARMSLTGVLVGMDRVGTVRRRGLVGRDIDYPVTRHDLSTMIEGLIKAGELLLAAGAEAVMPCTFEYHEFTKASQLPRLRELVRDSGDLAMGGGHPQGGNAISRDPARGVVGDDFRIHGMRNAFVCDASVFPTSVGVNPQLTVMALADYAAAGIARA